MGRLTLPALAQSNAVSSETGADPPATPGPGKAATRLIQEPSFHPTRFPPQALSPTIEANSNHTPPPSSLCISSSTSRLRMKAALSVLMVSRPLTSSLRPRRCHSARRTDHLPRITRAQGPRRYHFNGPPPPPPRAFADSFLSQRYLDSLVTPAATIPDTDRLPLPLFSLP